MGNHRFRLSDIMPNAWFYKLKDMSKTRKHNSCDPIKKKPPSTTTTTSPRSYLSQPRHSYYSTRSDKSYNSTKNILKASETHFHNPPRKSSKRRTNRKSIYKPSPRLATSSVSAKSCSYQATLDFTCTKPNPIQSPTYCVSPSDTFTDSDSHESVLPSDSESENFAAPASCELASWSSPRDCRLSSSTADIIIDMNNESFTREAKKLGRIDSILELDLPPILTKPVKSDDKTTEATKFRSSSSKSPVKIVKEESIKTQKEHKASPLLRRSSSNSTGIRLRANSPRLASRKIQSFARKSLSSKNKNLPGSFAVVKSSFDPERDFRDSMVEMIVENNIRASKDLEELLACYLSLNSNEYHDLIVKAFEQIWFDMADLRL